MQNFADFEIDMDLLVADVCRNSFYQFVKEFFPVIINETPVWNWHIEYLCGVLQEMGERVKRREPAQYEYVLINVPPGSMKSTLISIFYPMWCWTVDPSQRFICSSYAGDISMDLADKARRVYWSDLYQKLFPEVKQDKENEAKSHFKNIIGGERYATSTGSAITGIHAHQIIVDDPINPLMASSDSARSAANRYIDETLSTRKVDKLVTTTIIVQQRLHEEDSTGHLLDSGRNVLHICLPAEVSDEVKPASLKDFYQHGLFDPIRLNRTAIANLRKQLGTYAASSQLDQRPSPAEGGILKKAWFDIVDKQIPRTAVVKFKLDTAYTAKQNNDPTGLFAYFMEGGVMFIVNAEEQYMEFPQLKKYIPTYVHRNGYTYRSTIKIEPKACFVAGTKVRTKKGMVPIEKIKIGAEVLSYNELTKKGEYKKVINTYVSIPAQPSKDLITFVREDGIIIKCSSNHEFLINGCWNNAITIAERTLEMGAKYREQIPRFQYGSADNNQLQKQVRQRASPLNGTSVRQGRVLSNNAKNKRQMFNRKNAQNYSNLLYTEPGFIAGSESFKLQHLGQPGREFRMGEPGSEYAAHGKAGQKQRIYQRDETKEPGNRRKKRIRIIERTASKRNKTKIQKAYLFSKKIVGRIWRNNSNNIQCQTQGLEACKIIAVDMAPVQEPLYDLCVSDNHTYTITEKNIIVHNSGKSVVQELKELKELNILEDRAPKDDKVTRANAITAICEAGKVKLIRGVWNEGFLDQVAAFPNAKHDEHVDNLSSAVSEEFINNRSQYKYKRAN